MFIATTPLPANGSRNLQSGFLAKCSVKSGNKSGKTVLLLPAHFSGLTLLILAPFVPRPFNSILFIFFGLNKKQNYNNYENKHNNFLM